MRGTLAAHDIVKTYGAGVVVDGVSFTVGSGDRVGVVDANGIGKSTLLRILAGIEPADSGSVRRTPPELAVAYVPQEPDALPGETIRTYVARRTGVADAEAALVTAADCLANDASAADAYDAALRAFVAVGGGDLEARAPDDRRARAARRSRTFARRALGRRGGSDSARGDPPRAGRCPAPGRADERSRFRWPRPPGGVRRRVRRRSRVRLARPRVSAADGGPRARARSRDPPAAPLRGRLDGIRAAASRRARASRSGLLRLREGTGAVRHPPGRAAR